LSPEHAAQLADLVGRRRAAALGTLHAGAPCVSMVPYAVLADGSAFVIHVSRLAAHTKDMLADPRVSLLVMQPEGEGVAAQALARVAVQPKPRCGNSLITPFRPGTATAKPPPGCATFGMS